MPNEPASNESFELDVAIIGGGVAALWTANALKNAGYRFALFSNTPLGEGQSLAAQGVIHGGLKYALGGKLNEASEELKSMPGRWDRCLDGTGEIDLREVSVLSECQYLWSLPGVLSQVVSFFGSKALSGRAGAVKRDNFPAVFDSPDYRGRIFRIEERVLDPVSIISGLTRPVAEHTHQIDWNDAELRSDQGDSNRSIFLRFRGVNVRAKRIVFAAGKGNGGLLESCGISYPEMQTRPLHQIVIKKAGLPDFFSVCIGNTPKPPIVSTTHTDSEGRTVWYIGGDLAEAEGVSRSETEQIQVAREWFSKNMPWIDLKGADWSTIRVNRAEPKTESGARPPGAFCEKAADNIYVAWPTKLALAPDLADGVINLLTSDHISPGPPSIPGIPLPAAEIGKPLWM